jgi:hypothetical protein
MRRPWLLIVFGAVVWLAGGGRPAVAQRGPEKVFAGQIITSDKAFPTYAKSASAYVAAIKKQSRSTFAEDKEKGQWKIHFAAFLKVPLPDLEINVKLYEVSGKNHTLLNSFEQFTDQRGQRTIISKMVLDKKQVGVNKALVIEMAYKGKVLASGRFKIVGEGDRSSGKVDFSEGDGEEQ